MANNIELFKNYVTLLDEVYKAASLTSVLDGAAELAEQGANANELIIPKLTMEGLANYSRSSGYADGSVTMTNETVVCNFDRGRMFTVDNMDNAESAGIAFGRLSGEFIRTRVVPELDAFRLAVYAGTPGISKADAAALSNGAAVVSALRAAVEALDENEVPAVNRAAGFEVRSCGFLHWWTFLGFFGEMQEGLFSQILHIRQKRAKGKNLESWEKEFVRNHKNLVLLRTPEEQAAMEETEAFLDSLIGGGK